MTDNYILTRESSLIERDTMLAILYRLQIKVIYTTQSEIVISITDDQMDALHPELAGWRITKYHTYELP